MSDSEPHHRFSLRVHPTTSRILGLDLGTSPTVKLQGFIASHAARIQLAAEVVEPLFNRAEWNLLAESTREREWFDQKPLRIQLAQAVDMQHAHDPTDGKSGVDVDLLIAKLSGLEELAAEAVAIALRWRWDNADSIDPKRDRWWTVAYRTTPRTKGTKS